MLGSKDCVTPSNVISAVVFACRVHPRARGAAKKSIELSLIQAFGRGGEKWQGR